MLPCQAAGHASMPEVPAQRSESLSHILGLPVSPYASHNPTAPGWQLSNRHAAGHQVHSACSSALGAALHGRGPAPSPSLALTWKVALYTTCMLELPARVMTGGLLSQLDDRATPLQIAGAVVGGAVVVAATAMHHWVWC